MLSIFAQSDGGNVFGVLVVIALMLFGLKKIASGTPDGVKKAAQDGVVRGISRIFK